MARPPPLPRPLVPSVRLRFALALGQILKAHNAVRLIEEPRVRSPRETRNAAAKGLVGAREEPGHKPALVSLDRVIARPSQEFRPARLVDFTVGRHGLCEPEAALLAIEQESIREQFGGLDRQPEFAEQLFVAHVDLLPSSAPR